MELFKELRMSRGQAGWSDEPCTSAGGRGARQLAGPSSRTTPPILEDRTSGTASCKGGFRLGVYGWRKRCLYSLVLTLMVIVILNLALTVWLLKVMGFSSKFQVLLLSISISRLSAVHSFMKYREILRNQLEKSPRGIPGKCGMYTQESQFMALSTNKEGRKGVKASVEVIGSSKIRRYYDERKSKIEDSVLNVEYGAIRIAVKTLILVKKSPGKLMDENITNNEEGIGSLKVVPGGIELRGQAAVLDALVASSLRSRRGKNLVLESWSNFTASARSHDGRLLARFTVGEDRVDCVSRSFRITDPRGGILFSADREQVVVGAEMLRVTGDGGAVFQGSVQTPLVRGESGRGLRLESATRSLKISAPQRVVIESWANEISASCLTDLKLQSVHGAIKLDAKTLFMKGLKTASPSQGHSLHAVHRPCPSIYVCGNKVVIVTIITKHRKTSFHILIRLDLRIQKRHFIIFGNSIVNGTPYQLHRIEFHRCHLKSTRRMLPARQLSPFPFRLLQLLVSPMFKPAIVPPPPPPPPPLAPSSRLEFETVLDQRISVSEDLKLGFERKGQHFSQLRTNEDDQIHTVISTVSFNGE
ncbi:Zeta-sarcoglycan [Melipona quadrifasciata]|uniref:Zeta-sarcoglycan n=1 Tax=Melipona quadrifasciata TaxID=166423 RepID=A0A0N0BFQ4_9HYME|nr:Zeta-sarcoglycan [Melipona quadrifasciata]